MDSASNLYQPPLSSLEPDSDPELQFAVGLKLYPMKHIGWATIFGLMAGFWMIATNFKATGHPAEQRKTLFLGAGSMLVALTIFSALPDKIPTFGLGPSFVTFMTTMLWAQLRQDQLLKDAFAHGAIAHSPWRSVGVAILTLAALTILFLGLSLITQLIFPGAPFWE